MPRTRRRRRLGAALLGVALLAAQATLISQAATAEWGYWLVDGRGNVYEFGGAAFKGSAVSNATVVSITATPSGGGYWVAAADGGVFTFGDAPFRGSLGDMTLNRPVVGMAATPSGNGYWLVAADGGIFTFGDAPFRGSLGGQQLSHPIVAMASTPSGNGYWLVDSAGKVFAFDAPHFGDAGALGAPVADITPTPGGDGYWLADAGGRVHAFGAAEYSGGAEGCNLPAGIVGIAASGAGTALSPPPARPNCGLPTTPTTSGGSGSSRTLTAVADADVAAADAGRNFGSGSQMVADGSPQRQAYVRFDTSGLGTVSTARLRVLVKGGSANGPAIHRAGGAWSEMSITWANQPGPTGAALDNRGALNTGQWAEWNVTAAVAAGAGSFVLVPDSSDGSYFATREEGHPAQLVVTTSGTTSSDPVDPGDPTDPVDSPGGRPNFLVINTDDQRLDGTMDIMPKTRQWIAAAGTSFTQGFATTPLCCPSRSGLFSGRYTHNHGNLNNQTTDQLDQNATMQRYLHDAGYQTGMVGKFLMGWSNSTRPPNFDYWALTSGGYYDVPYGTDQGSLRADYSTWESGRQTLRILDAFERRDADPFFLYLAPQAPHDPWDPEPAYRSADVGAWDGNPAVHETDRSDKPKWVRDFHVDYAEGAGIRASQLRLLKSVDDMVDSVMRRLTALGEADNTVVIFTSDNGYLWGEHGMKSKYNPYDGSVRVPFIVRWPGKVGAGAVDPRPVGNVDIAPSLLAAAGISPRLVYPFDGRPFLDTTGLSGAVRPEAYLEYFMDEHRAIPDWSAIRTTRFNYVQYYDGDQIVYREYYDLVADPWEIRNLLGDTITTNDPDTSGLATRLARYRTCRGTTGTTACA